VFGRLKAQIKGASYRKKSIRVALTKKEKN